MKKIILLIMIIPILTLFTSSPLYADYQSDRQLPEPKNIFDAMEARLFLLYLGKKNTNTCKELSKEDCIKKHGKPDKEESVVKGKERLIYYGKKTLYRGTAKNNSAVGPEWREFITVDNRVEEEYEIIQIAENARYWMASFPRFIDCEAYGKKSLRSCDSKGEFTPFGSIPAFPEPRKIKKKYTSKEAAEVFWALISKRACDQSMDGFIEKSAPAYAIWRGENKELVDAIEENPEFEGNVFEDDLKKFVINPDHKASSEEEMRCNALIEHFSPGAVAADPGFATPTETWNTFLSSLKKGDSKTAIKCLTARAKRNHETTISEMSLTEMETFADSVKKITLTSSNGSFQEAFISGQNGHTGSVIFEKIGNIWKINDM